MTDILARLQLNRLWDFPGGIHPPEMKQQSNGSVLSRVAEPSTYYLPLQQHAGNAGIVLVKAGDYVYKGQALTQGEDYRTLPIHAPTSGTIIGLKDIVAPHPSGLTEPMLVLEADGKDQWREQYPVKDFLTLTPQQVLEKIYQAGIAGLGGAVFPTAAKLHNGENKIKLLIINAAECEPYISCDDRLMRDCPSEIIEGIRILRYLLRPEQVIIAIEDNKPEAIQALQIALQGANDIQIKVIPTKYPSGAAKQLIQILTGLEVPKGHHASSLGILMQNIATTFAIKRAVIDDEPLIERVVTLTGDKISHPRNLWVRFGTPIYHLLQQVNYQYDARFPVFMGGPLMGFILPDLNAPVTKATNCLIAPDHFEYSPPAAERNCIRCSSCSDACPVQLLPQQLYWFARSESHEKAKEYSIKECIECGICAYVCPSNIPLVQYFRQEKAKLTVIEQKARSAEAAKHRFEARQARLDREKLAREHRTQQAAALRRAEIAKQQGIDPVQAALERLKTKKTVIQPQPIATNLNAKGELVPDNSVIMAERKARRLARQQAIKDNSETTPQTNTTVVDNSTGANPEQPLDPRKAAIAAAVARAKAKKAQSQINTDTTVTHNPTGANPEQPLDPRKAAIAAAVARAKAKKAQQQLNLSTHSHRDNEGDTNV
ncbi:electron transport complex subunit RsxC [Mergibacter septicus]|uniref:electron transport complex subunit RsxC n=1 Tax=Mergibacter septicus TaxID=221402 RepID=UPI001178E5E6|nr:electron transport complex subunit RsxC [Mergibacter septicus]AWX13429.1 electron transport complex subunit RsxC [Mergibacter septicus]